MCVYVWACAGTACRELVIRGDNTGNAIQGQPSKNPFMVYKVPDGYQWDNSGINSFNSSKILHRMP